ncbi:MULTISPECIES: hypothetical protein [Metallosphaera]|uniref:Uncharacterized protein n=3 Tax=Metallosphaera TaxID=41980 RepID=A0A0K1SYY0_9CREN|nr:MULTISPECIES: hypothetical protein [Metallosphaera]AKV74591.1 hypothetical protein MsedA_1620 [Metallosphaera sedula]AKV77604.1 hypothetical protein MsedB_1622 [Metallosphaera sedula]AKV79850.1 hypothetical protein MsedC_1620 [Metallosphaera sedula]AKV82095.1 hypothetical protein MsedD_1621 [Metallosphaera sedula]AKV83559.1 hypothetical protein MsedE_1624 [Metallosphaera sedula]
MDQEAGAISGVSRALGPIIGLEVSLNTKQEQCLQQGLRGYFSLYEKQSARRYEVYLAIASSHRVSEEVDNDPDKIFRQGLLLRTEDTGEWYYVGGVSPHWTNGTIIAYQGGSKATSYGKIGLAILERFAEVGIGIFPMQRPEVPPVWYNPAQFEDCNGIPGRIWNVLSSYQVVFMGLLSNAPELRARSSTFLTYRDKKGNYYLSRSGEDEMRLSSDGYPFVYEGIGATPAKPIQIGGLTILGNIYFPFFTLNGISQELASICAEIMPENLCNFGKSFTRIGDADLGAPILTSIACGNTCSGFGVAGLVSGYETLSLQGLEVVAVRAVRPPPLTSTGVRTWAKELSLEPELQALLDGAERFKKALSEIGFAPFIALASATLIDWMDQSYEQALTEAKERASELETLYNKLVQQLSGNPPPVTDRLLYREWYQNRLKVENCASAAILEYPYYSYEDLVGIVTDCASR